MAEQTQPSERVPLALVAAVITQAGRMALVARGSERWRVTPGCTFVPIELPGCALDPDADLAETISWLTAAQLEQPGRVLPSVRLYGPSAAHAIDRLDSALEGPPLPLLRLERGAASEGEDTVPAEHAVQRVVVRAYLVALASEPQPGVGIAGILWAAPRALRAAMRGMPMNSLLGEADVVWQPSESTTLPEDALAYVPGDYGERHLLRLIAKYGPEALFQGDDGGSSRISGSSAQ